MLFCLDKLHKKEGPITPAIAGAIFAGVGAAVAVKGTIEQKEAAGKAAEEQRKSEQTQQRIRDLQTARQRRAQVREARVARAEIISEAGAGGTLQTSAAVGGAGSVRAQLGSNISFLDRTQALSRQASIFNIQAADFRGRAASAGATAGLGVSLFQASGSLGDLFKQ